MAIGDESSYSIHRVWEKETILHISFAASPKWEGRPNGLAAIRRGPLVYSLEIGEEWKQIHTDIPGREFPHCDYEIYPTTSWAYGFAGTEIKVEEQTVEDFPFSPKGAPVSLLLPCMPVQWESCDGCAAPLPVSHAAVGPVEIKRFLPYGCTNLRMTELPFVQK